MRIASVERNFKMYFLQQWFTCRPCQPRMLMRLKRQSEVKASLWRDCSSTPSTYEHVQGSTSWVRTSTTGNYIYKSKNWTWSAAFMIACMFLHSFIFHFYAFFSSSLDLGDVEASLHGSPAVLSIPILQPCLRSEQLLITIDTHTGIFQAHVPQYEDNPFTGKLKYTFTL